MDRIGWIRLSLCQSPQLGCAVVAERRAFAAGEHGRHPSAALCQLPAPDCVDALMHAEQPPGSPPVLDLLARVAERLQLRVRDDAFLPARGVPGEGDFAPAGPEL